jgi:phosphate acetyltransferase
MATVIYITSLEPESGKSLVSLGALDAAAARSDRIGYFRPVVSAELAVDPGIEMVRQRYQLAQTYDESYGVTTADTRGMGESVNTLLVHRILAKFEPLAESCDFVIVEGTDFTGASAAFEFSLNAELASHLAAFAVVVTRAYSHRPDQMAGVLAAAHASLTERHIPILGFVINRVPKGQEGEFAHLTSRSDGIPVTLLPEEPALRRPTLADVARVLETPVIGGSPEALARTINKVLVAAMTLPHLIPRLTSDCLLVVPGDRADVIVLAQASRFSSTVPGLAGLLLTGGYAPDETIMRFIEGMGAMSLPMLLTGSGTFDTVDAVTKVHGSLDTGDERRVALALRVFEDHMNVDDLAERLLGTRSTAVTPVMFERRLIATARSDKRHIVLPEGGDDRILTAADRLVRRDVVDLTILGDPHHIGTRAENLGLDLSAVTIIDPAGGMDRARFAAVIHEARKSKGMSAETAWDLAGDPSWYGTVMVEQGLADGMVSGAVHTTADTVRPALQIIRTAPGTSVVSSVFLMALHDRVLVYGDCAVIPDPDANQLADIALSSARTAAAFGIDPYVAMLSYSTGSSGAGVDVEKVSLATQLVRERDPGLPVEGPIQYDAAVDAAVAAAKLPGSAVAGRATVLVFPDLNTGNNTYKAVQRTSGAVAIGPILQGLRLPVNDLSRGATVDDIVNTVVITAIQAQQNGGVS